MVSFLLKLITVIAEPKERLVFHLGARDPTSCETLAQGGAHNEVY
jgi:hypothetical protein